MQADTYDSNMRWGSFYKLSNIDGYKMFDGKYYSRDNMFEGK